MNVPLGIWGTSPNSGSPCLTAPSGGKESRVRGGGGRATGCSGGAEQQNGSRGGRDRKENMLSDTLTNTIVLNTFDMCISCLRDNIPLSS